MKKNQNVSGNMPRCHFLLIVIVIAIMLIYKELFKNTKMSKKRIPFVKLLIFGLLSIVIRCNTEVKN